MNLIPGTKVAVRRGDDYFEGVVTRTEIVDGELYVIGEWLRKHPIWVWQAPFRTFRVHEDDVRPSGRP
jgi:hypothetical protein